MRWKRGHVSKDVEDLRGQAPPRRRGGKIALGGAGGVVALLVALLLGPDALEYLGNNGSDQSTSSGQAEEPADRGPAKKPTDELGQFISFVLDDVQDIWEARFQKFYGQRYERARLRIFNREVASACGLQSSATGPFYCPGDNHAYIDLGFYEDLKARFDAPGDFAQAYVIAHEIGHHVQNLVGTSREVHLAQRGLGEGKANKLSVRLELQADCLAGVWAHFTDKQGTLEPGDIEEGLTAAAAIGDDTIQKRVRGRVTPESWTHGSARQRVRWFMTGFETGDVKACDTFSVSRP